MSESLDRKNPISIPLRLSQAIIQHAHNIIYFEAATSCNSRERQVQFLQENQAETPESSAEIKMQNHALAQSSRKSDNRFSRKFLELAFTAALVLLYRGHDSACRNAYSL